MKLKLSLALTYLFIFVLNGIAQKKPLDHDVYDDWKDITSPLISNNGEFVMYEVNPAQGDGTLHLYQAGEAKSTQFDRGNRPSFSYDSRYAIFKVLPPYDSVRQMKLADKKAEELPKDALYVVELKNGTVRAKYERVRSYRLPDKGDGWLALLKENPVDTTAQDQADSLVNDRDGYAGAMAEGDDKPEGNELIIINLETQQEWSFERVSNFLFSENGRRLAFTQVAGDSTGEAGVLSFDTESQELFPVDSGKISYEELVISRDGESVAYLASEDSLKAENRYFTLMMWNSGESSAQVIADTTSRALPADWVVSENGSLDFSYDGNRLFFGMTPRPVEYAYEEDTTILDDERVKVDIWSWNDSYLQPMQLERREAEQNRSYTVVYDRESQEIVPLGSEELPDIQLDEKKRLGVAIGIDDRPYRKELSWEYPFHRDAYLVDISSGKTTPIVTNTSGYPRLSPGGTYAYWYEARDSSWYAYNIGSEETVNLTEQIDANFYDELNDIPALPGSYGTAGWTENDEKILLYDYYDIWTVDPESLASANLTNGYGRENGLAFRYEKLNSEETYIPADSTIILSAFDRATKQSGYYSKHTGNNQSPQRLLMDDYRFYELQKALDSDAVIYRRSSFQEFPDLWLSTTDFQDSQVLSDANPQQEDYLWGTAELVSWYSVDGTPLQGMLYKPENFDPGQQYPMMVYFYERNSDNLHRHWAPEPHRSIINFTFYTSRGYLVFVPDIVYKEGYPGESALNAVLSGTLQIIEQGFVDEERVGVQGHSWGGYQSAYIITRTNLFRAAEAGAPVANMTSAYGGIRWGSGMSRMFQYERTQSRIGGSLWEYPMRYIENSPIFTADKIQTPLLILHNDHDSAVPWEQGIELFVALRRLGKPVWMLNYNDETHWPLKYQNRKDFARRMQQYFDHYLKDEPMPTWMQEGVPATLKGRTLRYELTGEDSSPSNP